MNWFWKPNYPFIDPIFCHTVVTYGVDSKTSKRIKLEDRTAIVPAQPPRATANVAFRDLRIFPCAPRNAVAAVTPHAALGFSSDVL